MFIGFSFWQPGQVYFFSSTEAWVLCQEGLSVVPRGWQRQALTGLQGSWEAGPRGLRVFGCLNGIRGTVTLLGKPGEDISASLQVHCHGRSPDENGWWGWSGVGAAARDGPGTVYIPGTPLRLDHPFRLFLHLVLGGMLFGVYILRCFLLILIKACVDDRLVLDLRPALRKVSTYPVPESLSLPNSFIRELFL